MSQDDIVPPSFETPGEATGTHVASAWSRPTQLQTDTLKDGEEVAINVGGIVRKARWNAKSRKFEYEDSVSVANTDMMLRGATGNIGGGTQPKFNTKGDALFQMLPASNEIQGGEQIAPAKISPWSAIPLHNLDATRQMQIDPTAVNAFGRGESPLKHAGNYAVKDLPADLIALQAFMSASNSPWLRGSPAYVKYPLASLASAATHAGIDFAKEQTGILSRTEQDQINATLNPVTQGVSQHMATALSFGPKLGLIGAALGNETKRMTQREALGQMGQMGLANLGIVQAGGLSNAIVHGTGTQTDSPIADRGVALLRSLGLGDVSKEWGGMPGERSSTIAGEFALGAGYMHKPFGLGTFMHNAAHSDPAQKVKNFSGAPTWEAMKIQALNNQAAGLAAASDIIREQRERAQSAARDQEAPNTQPASTFATPLTPEAQHGLHQVKTALKRALDNKNITKDEHDTASAVADTLGEAVLKNIRLRQIGGNKGNTLGDSDVDNDSKGLATSVTVFAKALKTNRFNATFVHEVFHPIFESLHPDLKKAINSELIQARIDARAKNRGLDEYLKKLGIGNEEKWDFRLLSNEEGAAMINHLQSVGVKNARSLFVKTNAGYVLSRDAAADGGKREGLYRRVYSLQNAREFATDEAARAVARRGKYDAKWGNAGKNWAVVNLANRIFAWLHTTVDGYHRNNSKTVNEILDNISNKTIEKITESRDSELPGYLFTSESQRKTNRQLYGSDSEPLSNEDAQVSALEELRKAFAGTHEGRVFAAREEIAAREREKQIDLERRRNNTATIGEQSVEGAKPESESDPSTGRLSEGDADPALPDQSKKALKELGIKNTVIGNVVRHSAIGTIRTEFDKANTAGEVAHIFRNTSQATQESIQVLVTDKDGNPLEIYRHTLSEPGASTLAPHVMIAQALSVKGAKKVWVSHNHPSMTPEFSPSDLNTEYNIRGMFKGTGLKLEGFLAIAGDKYAFIGNESRYNDFDRQVIPGSRFPTSGKEVPIIERRFTLPRGEGNDHLSQRKATSDTDQRMLVSELLNGKPGVIFLDRNDMAVGHQEVTPEKMGKLGAAGVRNLLGAYSRSGGHSMIVHVGDSAVPESVREAAATNVANMGAAIRGGTKPFIKAIISTDNSGQSRFPVEGERRKGWKSEGDESSNWRGEAETRTGVGAIKPLHAAPASNFPIMAEKLKDFGFEKGYLNQFSEHAIVGELKTGVTNVRTAGDVASLMHDYSSTLAQGQTMILIVGADGKPIQVGLHMIDSSSNAEDKAVIKPMWGVLAGQAVSTPGAKEAWMVRINNDIVPGEADGSIQNELALKNLLEGSGINYRGMVSVSGSKYRSIEYKPGVQNPNGGANQFDSTNVDWMPIDKRPATATIPLTERRYTTRSQMPYDTGVTDSDRPIGAEDAKWNRSENESAKRIREHLGGDPGVVFKTSSGKIVGTVHLTLDEMANIRNSPAQKTLLAMMDRAGVNWGMVSIGDAPNDPAAARATSNINAFLKQMGLKVTDTFHNSLGVVPGDPVGTSEYRWQSEGDADPGIGRDLRSKEGLGMKPPAVSMKLDPVEARVAGISSLDFKIDDRQLSGHVLQRHLADFESVGIQLGSTRAEQVKNLRAIITQSIDSREGIARIGQGVEGGFGARSDGSKDSRISVISTYGNNPIQMVFEATPSGNELITAFPIDQGKFRSIKSHPTYKPSKGNTERIDFERAKPLRKMQADAGAQHPEPQIQGPIRGGLVTPPPANPERSSDPAVGGKYANRRGMLKPTAFSEGDAQEFGDRAKRAIEQDTVIGPEAIKGDFLGWAKSVKVLADQHLYQHPFPGNSGDYEGDIARDKDRLAKHAVLDQLIAKLERQKGFNPMTLKPGMLKQVRGIHDEVVMTAFKEIGRNGLNMIDHVQDDMPMRHVRFYLNSVLDSHKKFTSAVYTSMQAGMTSKKTGMELIDMANDMRSRFVHIYDSNYPDDYTRNSEGDAENMRIPGGARDEAMKRRPARTNKTYLQIGHGAGYGDPGAQASNRPYFDPENVFLYHFDSEKGKFVARKIADIAEEEGIDPHDVKADSFVHGDQGELGIDTGVGVKRGESGVNGRIEIDHKRQIIFVSAGSSRGELNNFRKGDMSKMRAEALAQVRSYVEHMQAKGTLPKGYKIEGYGYDANRSVWENQERFSEGDAEPQARSFREANHNDAQLLKNGFITNYADKNWIRGLQRNDAIVEVTEMGNDRARIFSPSKLNDGRRRDFKLEIMDRVTGREIGHLYFDIMDDHTAYVVSTSVKERMENRGVAKIMYAELGERLRRAGITDLTGMVIDEIVDKRTGELIRRPIAAREAVFGLGSTEAEHVYGNNDHYTQEDMDEGRVPKSEQVWNHANVRTEIDPKRRLSEGDAEPAMPPDTNPRTNGGELANHTNAQLAKRGFISNYAYSKLKSLAGMKIRIGLQTDGTKPTTPITEGMKLDMNREENTFQGKVEYTGENGLIEVAQFTYVIKNHEESGDRDVVPSDLSGTMDWIKIKPQFRGRDLSNVITAEIAERLKRLKIGNIDAFVVDPEGRPIKAFQRIFGDKNVDVYDNGFEETDGRDPFRLVDPRSDTGFVRRTHDIEAKIDPKKLYSEGDAERNYEGLAFSEADVRKYLAGKPEERRAIFASLPDKKNRDEFRIMAESIRQSDFDNRPGAAERRAKQEARRQEIIQKYKEQGHPYPELAADQELNPPPTGPDPESELENMRRSNRLDRGNFNSEGDGENMRIPGGARDEFQRRTAGIRRPKPIRFWTDIGHADRRDAEGEQNTYLWYATKNGDIQVISADELRNAHSPEGYQLIESDDIPTHADWETHLNMGNIQGDYGKQPIMDLPHGRIDDRGDVTKISYMDHHRSGRTDYEFLRDEIKQKLASFMLKKADEMPGYDFTRTAERGTDPERFSEGDAENMRIPGGARDEALKKREAMLKQKRFRAADMDLLYTDIGHGDKFDVSGGMDTVRDPNRQFLWSYDKYGQFHMQSLREAIEEFNDLRMRTYKRRLAAGESETSLEYLKAPITESSFTHTEWAQGLGLSSPRELDYKIGNGRLDITDNGKVRMSWVAKIKDVDERQMMAQQIKEEAAAWLNSNKAKINLPYWNRSVRGETPFGGTEPGKIVGWNWGHGSEESTGRPRRFSEGDAENGRWPNQERAKGKIPNARISNGETDLGFVLDPGEMLDSKGLRIRNDSKGRMTWGDIGHDPEYFVNDKAVIEAMEAGQVLPGNFDSAAGLFAYNAKTGRVETTQDRLFVSHLDWLSPNNQFKDPSFGKVPDHYTMMGRFEPAIIGTDGKVIRRGRISLARNTADGNWVFDLADFSRSDIPPGALDKIKAAAAEESNAILDEKNRAKFEPAQDTSGDHYDIYGFGMAKDKADMGFSPKDTGPLKLDEGAKTYRDLAERPIGEGKDGQARLKKIAGKLLSEGDAVEETPFTVPNNAGNRTNMELARDIVRARFFTGISNKAHDNAAEFPLSNTMKRIADMIHARAGAEAGVTGLDLPTSIMKERTKHMNRFFEIMDPLRSEFASMDRATREQAYRDMADMVTGLKALDTSTPAGRAAQGLKDLLRDLHDYRTAAGEKLGEVEDYFPAVYDSVNISENAIAFKEDAKRAYMIELRDQFQGEELEAAAEKAARELTMSHIRGENAGSFNDLFGSEAPAMGENSSMKRKFGPESQQIMSKWQIKDPYRIISRYIAGATKSAELVRRLGNEGQEWRKMAQALEKEGVSYEKIDEMRDLLKAAVGVGLRQNTRGEQTFIDLMGLYTAGSVMGRSFLNNMFEPASMGIRSGNLALGLQAYGETWARAIHNAARIISGGRIDKTFWEQYAEHIGTISADINDAWMNSHSIEVDGDRSDPRINWLTSKVYQANLLQLTENAKLQASHAIGFKYLVNLAEMQQGKSFMNKLDVTESVKSSLRELGIKDADHAAFAQWVMRLSALDDAGRMRALTSGGKMSKLFEQAITKFSMQASVRANRAHKPVFQDGPVGKTLFQLMSYSYAYAAEVNSRTYSYAKSALKSAPAGKSYTVGDRIRFMAPLMMVPMSIVAFRAMFALKDEMYPTEYSEKHKNDPWYVKWLNATSFAGAFGPKVEMAIKYVMRDQPPGGPLGQLVVGMARAAKTAVSNAIEGKPQDNAKRQAAKAAVPAIKAGAVIGATAAHPAAGVIASQIANSTSWSNAMTESDKKETDEKKDQGYKPYTPKKQK